MIFCHWCCFIMLVASMRSIHKSKQKEGATQTYVESVLYYILHSLCHRCIQFEEINKSIFVTNLIDWYVKNGNTGKLVGRFSYHINVFAWSNAQFWWPQPLDYFAFASWRHTKYSCALDLATRISRPSICAIYTNDTYSESSRFLLSNDNKY